MKYTTVTTHVVEYYNFDAFVEETYGKEYSVASYLESGNDVQHGMGFIKKGELDSYEDASLKDFINGEHYETGAYNLLQDMVNKDLIPEGDYTISVSW